MANSNPHSSRLFIDKLFHGVVLSLTFLTFVPLFFLLVFLIYKGMANFNFDLLTKLPPPGSFRTLTALPGGAVNAILGSLVIVAFSILIATPLGVFIGIHLAENPKAKMTKYVKILNDMLQGIPSIVIGVVAYIWFVLPFKGFSGFSGSLALAMMMLPMIVATTAEVVSLVPLTLKEASYALGGSYRFTLLRIVLPTAAPGIITGMILGASRIMGETAPLLFTAFGDLRSAHFDVSKPMHSLPLLIYEFSTSAYENLRNIGWSASLLLVLIILGLNLITKIISFRYKIKI